MSTTEIKTDTERLLKKKKKEIPTTSLVITEKENS
jgi:hypothetical protein